MHIPVNMCWVQWLCLIVCVMQSEEVDEDDSEQENSSVHSSSVRSDSSGRVKKNKRGRPAKKKKKGEISPPPIFVLDLFLKTMPLFNPLI